MKKTHILNTPWAALALVATALAIPSAHAATVWNVNIGNEIDTINNFVGAALENTVNSTWNSVLSGTPTNQALVDSTGAASTATLTIATTQEIGYGNYAPLISGPDIFDTWIKSGDNATPYTMTIGGLSASATYDLVIYSEWYWAADNYLPVTQTVGTGLTETVYSNRGAVHDGNVADLIEDTDLAQNGATVGNWIRINGLTPDVSGNLAFSMGGRDTPLNGFQLVQVPEPSAALLGGLGLLALLRRRR